MRYGLILGMIALIVFMSSLSTDKNTLPLSKSVHDFEAIYLGLVAYMNTKSPSNVIFAEQDFEALKDYIDPEILPGSGKGDPWEREYNYTILNDRGETSDRGRILIVWTRGFSNNDEVPVKYQMVNSEPEKINFSSEHDKKMWALYFISSNQKVIYGREYSSTRAVRSITPPKPQ